jgi:hypothetical protein
LVVSLITRYKPYRGRDSKSGLELQISVYSDTLDEDGAELGGARTSTVGLPRLSKIWRALTLWMVAAMAGESDGSRGWFGRRASWEFAEVLRRGAVFYGATQRVGVASQPSLTEERRGLT